MKMIRLIFMLIFIWGGVFGEDAIPSSEYINFFDNGKFYGMGDTITATSHLKDQKSYDRYRAREAFDEDSKTAWCEGVKGDGIGEKLGFVIYKEKIKKVKIWGGFGDPKFFLNNNRIKQAKLYLFQINMYDPGQNDNLVYINKKVKEMNLNFKDVNEFQEFEINIENKFRNPLAAVIEIVSVYPGKKHKDTCISEVVVEGEGEKQLFVGELPAGVE